MKFEAELYQNRDIKRNGDYCSVVVPANLFNSEAMDKTKDGRSDGDDVEDSEND